MAGYFLIALFLGPLLLVGIKSFFGQVAFHPRYLLFTFPFYVLFIFKTSEIFITARNRNLYAAALVCLYIGIIFHNGWPYWLVEKPI